MEGSPGCDVEGSEGNSGASGRPPPCAVTTCWGLARSPGRGNGFAGFQTRAGGCARPHLCHLTEPSGRSLESCFTHVILEKEGPLPRPCSHGGGRDPPHRPQTPREPRFPWEPCFCQTDCSSPFSCIFLLIVSKSGNMEVYFLIRRKKTLPTERPTEKDRPDEPSGFSFNNRSESRTALA